MQIPYDRPIFFIYLLTLENSPSNFLGANRWPADFAAPRAWKRRFQAQGKLFTLAGKDLSTRAGFGLTSSIAKPVHGRVFAIPKFVW